MKYRVPAEDENYVAFLAQLNVLFTQISTTVNSKDLSNTSKVKLADIRAALEVWVEELGKVLPQGLMATSVPQLVALASADANLASSPVDGNVGEEVRSDTTNMELGSIRSETVTESLQDCGGSQQQHTFTAGDSTHDMSKISSRQPANAVSDSIFRSKTIMDLVAFVQLLLANGLPESSKLRASAKAMVRLVVVRCCSTVAAGLQHVLHQTSSTTRVLGNAKATSSTASKGSDNDNRDEIECLEIFAQLASDIRLSTRTLKLCLELVIQHVDISSPSYMRFVMQLCVNVAKQIRHSMLYFQSSFERECVHLVGQEFTRVAAAIDSTGIDACAEGHFKTNEGSDKVHTSHETTSPEVDTYVQHHAESLRQLWGPFLTYSIAEVGSVLTSIVKFLVEASAIHELGAVAELAAVKLDAQTALFSLGSSMLLLPKDGGKRGIDPSGKELNKSMRNTTEQSVEHPTASDTSNENLSSSRHAFSPETPPSSNNLAARCVLLCLGVSFQAEYITTIAECCGDENDGRLVATRILSDALNSLLKEKEGCGNALLRRMLQRAKWRRALLQGIVNCIVSLRPVVLCAGLNSLRLLVTSHNTELIKDVGYIYSYCVFPLLESSNSPNHVKKYVLSHLISTFLSSSSDGVPMLLHLYHAYDLNIHAHQLNPVQKFVSILSQIVRQASWDEFSSDTTPHQPQDRLDDRSATSSLAAQPSIPFMALNSLLLIMEGLGRQAPPESDYDSRTPHLLQVLDNRVKKLEQQRFVERFSESKNAIHEYFQVREDEIDPQDTNPMFAKEYDHKLLPRPASNETEEKIQRVVDFLQDIHTLYPETVVDYLTTPSVFPLQVCMAYMERLPLAGCGLVEALRVLFAALQLPKEGQRVERMLEYFASAYFKANNVPGIDRMVFPFADADSCFLVVVASVMLNTSLHNPMAGSRMRKDQFCDQLLNCDELKDCPLAFFHDIFHTINQYPLNSAKKNSHIAQDNGHGRTSSNADSYGGLDSLFISTEERRMLSFELERHHLVNEIQYLLERSSMETRRPISVSAEGWSSQLWWCAAARDLYLNMWPSVCVIFGPSLYEGKASPEIINKCIQGLQSLMCIAASFSLPTECEVALLALLRMSTYDAVREPCRNALLAVATTAHSANFSARSWYLIFNLLVELHSVSDSAVRGQVESMLARIESYTRRWCEEAPMTSTPDNSEAEKWQPDRSDGGRTGEIVLYDDPGMAVYHVLEGLVRWLLNVPEGNSARLGIGLRYLKRVLSYSVITHSGHATDVVNLINVRIFAQFVMPHLIELVCRHAAVSECLQVIFECVVDLLDTMFTSTYANLRYVDTVATDSTKGSSCNIIEPSQAHIPSSATYLTDFVTCFDLFKLCFVGIHPSCMLVKVHLLQATKELMSRILRSAALAHTRPQCISNDDCSKHTYLALEFSVAIATWRRVLYPLVRALSDRETSGTEVVSLAGLVLRQLVSLKNETGSAVGKGVPTPVSSPPFVHIVFSALLAHAAYIGCMCADLDCAQICVAQLNTICSDDLNTAAASSRHRFPEQPGDSLTIMEDSPRVPPFPLIEADPLLRSIVECFSKGPEFIVLHILERLSLVLRCEREQIRSEAVENLRTLSLQLQPSQVRVVALQVSEVVLESTLGCATPHHTVSLTDPRLVSFCIFMMEVPPTMRQCSRTAFRVTLPSVLGFLTKELLAILPVTHLGEVAQGIMEQCLVPIVVSPRVNSPLTRAAAARSLTQCALFCLTRHQQQQATAGEEKATTGPSRYPFTSVLNCICLVLLCTRMSIEGVVPADAEYVSKTWPSISGDPFAGKESNEFVDYMQRAQQALRVLSTADPLDIISRPRGASMCIITNDNVEKQQQVMHPQACNVQALGNGTRKSLGMSTTTMIIVDRENDRAKAKENSVSVSLPLHQLTPEVELVTDRQLVEYCNFLVQVLSGLPKMLSDALARPPPATPSGNSTQQESEAECDEQQQRAGWAPPAAPATVFIELLLESARILFASLWRVRHAQEMQPFYAQCTPKGREIPPEALKTSMALLPHTPLRGVLNSYVELAILTESYPLTELLRITVDMLRSIPNIQAGSTIMQPPHCNSHVDSSAAAEWALLQRMSPQEQQHVRACSVGMYQELAMVVSNWIKNFIQPPAQLSVQRREALREMCLDTSLILSLVELLSPTFEPLILTVKGFLVWYIAQGQLTVPVHSGALPSKVTSSPVLPSDQAHVEHVVETTKGTEKQQSRSEQQCSCSCDYGESV
ncbi:unnamed protein product [Phytomonas sp. EM1]|nr:unnamed protein product [Phytomonas sp. EM1]|eukprot:CCW64522.1 unnamed protein product [Phytomonas sp. isolate EM1]